MAGRGINGAIMRGLGVRDHDATVRGREQITANFVRVRLHSPTLFDEIAVGPSAWIRLWFPDPDGSGAEHQRGYTLSEADPATGEFAIDVVLHEPSGPASAWAREVQPGTAISVSSSASPPFALPEEMPRGFLLLGDSASIPAINGILATLPAEVPVELYLELHEETDREIPLGTHPRLALHWVPRRGEESLAAAIEARDWSDWTVWAAPESGTMKHLRTRLREEFGFPKAEVHARAYWYEGRAFGKRRSAAEVDAAGTDSRPTGVPAGTPSADAAARASSGAPVPAAADAPGAGVPAGTSSGPGLDSPSAASTPSAAPAPAASSAPAAASATPSAPPTRAGT